jgi:hypothetical protein
MALTHCGASACVGVPTTLVPILESDGAHAPFCTSNTVDCQYCHATLRKMKLETAYHLQREITRTPVCTKNALRAKNASLFTLHSS